MLRTAIKDCSYRKLIIRSPASRDAATLQPFLDVPGDEYYLVEISSDAELTYLCTPAEHCTTVPGQASVRQGFGSASHASSLSLVREDIFIARLLSHSAIHSMKIYSKAHHSPCPTAGDRCLFAAFSRTMTMKKQRRGKHSITPL
jgi:hypothetical protein